MKRWSVLLLVILVLVYFRIDFFSIASISGPLFGEAAEPLSQEASLALLQSYHYLGKGKQAYAFASADGKWVLKFFNQKYFKVPFWAAFLQGERTKREKRRKFYLGSYRIASKLLKEETGIVYLHQGLGQTPLPQLALTDKAGRTHRIDLNETPFVLQKRAEPLYPALKALTSDELNPAIDQFLTLIASRIDLRIADGDHDVKNNFGMLEGRIVHLDPGRLYIEEALWEPEKLKYEWWSATHRFREWLEQNHPDRLTFFDKRVETNLQRVLQRPPASPLPRTDVHAPLNNSMTSLSLVCGN